MHDRILGLSAANVLAWACALVGLTLLTIPLVVDPGVDRLWLIGMPVFGAGMVARIRFLLCRTVTATREMSDELRDLMTSFFDAGREVGRAESTAPVRPLR